MTIKSLSLITATLLLTTNIYADETLEPITVVSTNKTAQSITNTTSNIEVITAEDIEEKGYQTVAQAIEQRSGIILSRSGGVGQLTSVFTRGMNSGQTLILLDGMRLNDPSSPNGTAYIETLTTANIQQIEILKGGSSSIWGSNASAGVINIITKEAKAGVHGSVGLSYGSYNTRGADADLSYKDEKLTAQVLASYLNTDGFSALAPRSAEEDGYENKSYNLKLAYSFNENNNLELSYNDIKTNIDYDNYDPNDNNSKGDSKQKNYALAYTFKLNDYNAIFHASKSDIERHNNSIGQYDSFISLNEATSKEYSFVNQYIYDKNKVILGFEYKDIDGLSESTYTSAFNSSYDSYDFTDSSYKNRAMFISNTYYINDTTLLETNLRYDDFDKFDNKTTYKIGLKNNHKFLEGFSTSANYYTAYDAPSTYYLSKTAINSLKPMYTKGFDITVGYNDLLILTYFNNQVEDNFQSTGSYPNETYFKAEGTEKFEGLEIQSSYTFSSLNLNLSANYTHLFKYEKDDGTDEDGIDLIRRPKDVFNASAEYYLNDTAHFGINAQYIGDRIDTDYNTFPASEVSTGNYTLWNLNFTAKIAADLDLNINAKNIFDKEYQSVYGYATEGRSIYAKIKYSF